MATDVILPRVDMDMTEGRISHWFVKSGARVEKGTALFEIETDKAAMEIDAPASGRVQIVVAVGAKVPVGSTVGWILADGEAEVTPAATAADASTEALDVPEVAAVHVAAADVQQTPSEGIRATPLSRRLAAEHGLDLSSIAGSGPKGRIQADDVTAVLAEKPAMPRGSGALLNGAWLRQGEGTPIVMIHGFGADLGGWRPFVQNLPATLPIYALDLPGHGASALGDVHRIKDIVAAVDATLANVGIAGGHLVGHSLGGVVATLLAANGQFAAKSLFLIAPGGLGPEVNMGFIRGFAGATSEAALTQWMRELVEDAGVITPALVKATAKARAGSALPAMQSVIADMIFPDATQGGSILAELAALTIPVRVVFGRADRIIPAAHADRLDGRIAVHRFARVGHMPHFEAGEAVADLLLQHTRSAG